MEKINELFEVQITSVVDAYPSVYTKDDVVLLLATLRTQVLYEASELKPTVGLTEDQFQAFASDVNLALERSYENRIEIENIDVLTDNITDELHDILLDQFQVHFGNFIIDKNEVPNNS